MSLLERTLTKIRRVKDATVGLRKLFFALLLLSVTTLLVCYNVIDGSSYALIWSTVGPAFMAANVIAKFSPANAKQIEQEEG